MEKLKLLIITMIVGLGLVGCTNSKLSPVYDEGKLKADSQEIVQMFCNEEYDKIISKMTDSVATQISAKQLEEVWSPMEGKLGKFKSISKEDVVGQENLATVVTIAQFENGKVQFTITYNEEMELEGLYLK